MTDLDLLVGGAMVSFLSVAGAYVAMRQRANESPVASYESTREDQPVQQSPTSHSIPPR
jgi:hypothetical protein